MIHARFDGQHATVSAYAHAQTGDVVIAIGGPLGGGVEIDRNAVPQLVRELGAAHVKAAQIAREVHRAA